MDRIQVMELVGKELDRQREKWGRPEGEWPDSRAIKYLVLSEEVGEVAEGLLNIDDENVKDELVQVAAVCFSWLMSDYE